MKIVADKTQLLGALSRVRNAANPKSSMPILANVLITASAKGLTLYATDLNVSVMAAVDGAEVDGDALVAVGARGLFDIVKNAADGKITMTVEGTALRIKAGRSNFKLPTMPGDSFPAMPTTDAEYSTVDGDALGMLLGMTHYAASTDTTRDHMFGVHLSASGGVVKAMATDSHRAACASAEMEGAAEFDTFIPLAGVSELRGLLSPGESVGIAMGDTYACARVGSTTLAIKLGRNEFPPVGKLITQATDGSRNRFKVDRTAMLDTLRRVGVVASGKDTPLVVADIAEGVITLSGANVDVGEGSDAVDTDYAGEPVRVAFSPRYIVDAIAAVADDVVDVAVGDAMAPIVITSKGACDFVSVTSPMREPGK